MSLNQTLSHSVLGHHLFGEAEISCACELNYILAPIDNKTRLNKMKKKQPDVMWERKGESLFWETYQGDKGKEEENLLSDSPVMGMYAIIRQHLQTHSVYPSYLIQLSENSSSLMECMQSTLQPMLACRQTAIQK